MRLQGTAFRTVWKRLTSTPANYHTPARRPAAGTLGTASNAATPKPRSGPAARLNVLASRHWLLAGVTTFILAQAAFPQPAIGPSDPRLDTKVRYTSAQASVQDIVQSLAQQAGLRYDRQRSFAQTDPLCRQWVRNVAIDAISCRQALEQILKPVGLRYQVDNDAIVLSRSPSAPAPAKGYVTTGQPPAGLMPTKILSSIEQRDSFNFLCEAIDQTYAGFELKSINWDEVRQRYLKRLDTTGTADQFYRLLFELVNELKDTHSRLQNFSLPIPASGPELTVDLFEDKPFVVAVNPRSEPAGLGAKPGWEILEVDGMSVQNKMDRLRSVLPACSSERAFRREACRHLLAGEKSSTVSLKLRPPNGHPELLTLHRSGTFTSPPPPACTLQLTGQRFVHFGRHPSGLGYIRIASFDGREEIAEEFDRALETLRATPGLILDIRDNPGGYGQLRIVGRFLQKPTLGAIGYTKSGPGHRDLQRHDEILVPTGQWQYSGPVALLVNDITGSAADLFACYLRSANRVVTIGSTTHGNLSGVAAFAVLPCGLVVRISNGYVCDATGKPIEGVGNEPDVTIAPTITDFVAGKDPVLEKAAALVNQKLGPNKSGA